MRLREPRQGWASRDFLFVRLRCRRAGLRQEGLPVARDGDLWSAWRSELTWIYDRLPGSLRGALQPVFVLEELRQLLLALRFLAAGERDVFARLCSSSLFAEQIRNGLLQGGDLQQALSFLERQAGTLNGMFAGAWQRYLDDGPGGLEQQLQGRFLQWGRYASRQPAVRAYFTYLIDMRNLLGVFKHLRWQVAAVPDWLEGGRIAKNRVMLVWQQKDLTRLAELAQWLAGTSEPLAADLEEQLWRGLNLKMRCFGRDPLQPGLLLDYLVCWQLAVRARAAEL